jgi:hypothetical protein
VIVGLRDHSLGHQVIFEIVLTFYVVIGHGLSYRVLLDLLVFCQETRELPDS